MTYSIIFFTYSGMSIPLATGLSSEEARDLVKKRITAARSRGQLVSRKGKGEWEFESPEDAVMISDRDGILSARKTR